LMTKFDVVASISNDITPGRIDIQISHGRFDHPGPGFSAPAPLPVRRIPHVRVMRTVIDPVKMSPCDPQKILHFLMNLMDQRLREITSCHSRLIGNHHGFELMLV